MQQIQKFIHVINFCNKKILILHKQISQWQKGGGVPPDTEVLIYQAMILSYYIVEVSCWQHKRAPYTTDTCKKPVSDGKSEWNLLKSK